MAFITQGTTFYSFATYDDVVQIDSRLFSANEGLSQDSVEESLIRSTERILDLIRNTDWWKNFYISKDGFANVIVRQAVSVPALDPFLIIDRQGDFTDLTVYHALSNYLLPKVADFGNPDSAERQKIGFYDEKFRTLLSELITDGDWYDFDESGTITDADRYPFPVNLQRRR